MQSIFSICFRLTFLAFLLPLGAMAQQDYAALVNPFIGTGGHGHTYPGASMPFGGMQLSPDTRGADWDGSSGYHYSDSLIYGFSHTHLNGTGIPDYCDLLFMPFTGKTPWQKEAYRSGFSHKNEKATPGYYEVLLDRQQIKAQLTTALRSGLHQYHFQPSEKEGALLIDLSWRDEVLESWLEKVSDYELRGLRRSRSWAQNQSLYFSIKFEKPIQSFELTNDDGKTFAGNKAEGKNLKAAVRFVLGADRILKAKVGISGVSAEGAKRNLDTEIPHWNFEKVRTDAKRAWNKELGKLEVKGGTPTQQTIFYTALYHTFLSPNILQDVDGQYRGTDLKIHQANNSTNYSVFSLWDTYRAYNPLMTILNQQRTADWISTFLQQYKYGGMLPVWELAGNETFCMIGYHSVPVIVDALQKGIGKFDKEELLQAARSYAESERFGLKQYQQQGYISNSYEPESVSKTLEYAYDDWCIAQLAKMAGNDTVYQQYIRRAQYYKNLFDPKTKHMRGKLQGLWVNPFDAREINNFYTEGNSWQYSFAAPQDISTLMELYGGREKFIAKLDELFTTDSKTTGRDQQDVTGLIGQYAQGNEPSHHMAYLYAYAGEPWRTQELVQKICAEFYTNAPDGLIGNEDCGQMSAWYIFSALGFYPVCPGSGQYVLGAPLFDEVKLNLENGKSFLIKANRQNSADHFVTATKRNGLLSSKLFLLHSDIMKGGSLEFLISKSPDQQKKWREEDQPESKIKDQLIQPNPMVIAPSNKFKDSLAVSLESIDANAKLFYQLLSGLVDDSLLLKGQLNVQAYNNSLFIKETSTLVCYAQKDAEPSKRIVQHFYQLPTDRSITVLSKVHPMYTAGGPEALIDGITGSANWRAGEWQSYYDSDFEAVIDLQKERPVTYVGAHFLQEVSPWILYPKEVRFSISSDGVNFTELASIQNKIKPVMTGAQTQLLGATVSAVARYVKVKAISGGKLPAEHESAGNPSHLFIDEVIVK